MKGVRTNPHYGSKFEDFLAEDGTLKVVTAAARKRLLAWQVAQLMALQKISKTE